MLHIKVVFYCLVLFLLFICSCVQARVTVVGEMHLADDEVETKTDEKVDEVDYESEPEEEEEKPKKKEVDLFIQSTTPILSIHLNSNYMWVDV